MTTISREIPRSSRQHSLNTIGKCSVWKRTLFSNQLVQLCLTVTDLSISEKSNLMERGYAAVDIEFSGLVIDTPSFKAAVMQQKRTNYFDGA